MRFVKTDQNLLGFSLIHISDFHLCRPAGAPLAWFGNKRALSYFSWRIRRRRQHDPAILDTLVQAVRAEAADHVVVTGDLTQLALAAEFEAARRYLAGLGSPQNIFLVPGNHDALVGAGYDPAGLFATRALATQGCRVLLLNRDIMPGGLAEYGIFLAKYKMKTGLRKQFQKILSDAHVTYLGNVTVREGGALTVEDLRGMGFDALVFAIGAQGTKYLGVEGERLAGVYHAKDLVYHYNRLPPFSEQPFPLGRRVAVVGVGNVMIDIANYAAHFCDCEEIIAIARRGPFEKAYDDKEFEDVEDAFDRDAYRRELERIRPRLAAIDQNVDELLTALDGSAPPASHGNFAPYTSMPAAAHATVDTAEDRLYGPATALIVRGIFVDRGILQP